MAAAIRMAGAAVSSAACGVGVSVSMSMCMPGTISAREAGMAVLLSVARRRVAAGAAGFSWKGRGCGIVRFGFGLVRRRGVRDGSTGRRP